MNITASIAVSCVVGLVLGNFAHQAFTGLNAWEVAADRSFFQAMAVGVLMLSGWLADKAK